MQFYCDVYNSNVHCMFNSGNDWVTIDGQLRITF